MVPTAQRKFRGKGEEQESYFLVLLLPHNALAKATSERNGLVWVVV